MDVIFDKYDLHRKMSFKNRAVIAGANGIINLSIPLLGGRDQKTIASQVMIDNSVNWQSQHFKSIVSAYNRSPYFEHYSGELSTLFEGEAEYLFEWNLRCINWLRSATRNNWPYTVPDNPVTVSDEREVSDLRNYFSPRQERKACRPRTDLPSGIPGP